MDSFSLVAVIWLYGTESIFKKSDSKVADAAKAVTDDKAKNLQESDKEEAVEPEAEV
jgi:hypothetical protein